MDADLNNLRLEMLELAEANSEQCPELAWNGRKVAIKCLTAQGQYEAAIREYGDLIDDTEDEIEALFIEIDMALVEMCLNGDFIDATERTEMRIASLQDRIEQLYEERFKGDSSMHPVNDFRLTNAFPNPFNSSLNIRFSLDENSPVRLAAFDLQGRQVAEILNSTRIAGEHSLTWKVENVPTGTYLLRLERGNLSSTRYVLLLK